MRCAILHGYGVTSKQCKDCYEWYRDKQVIYTEDEIIARFDLYMNLFIAKTGMTPDEWKDKNVRQYTDIEMQEFNKAMTERMIQRIACQSQQSLIAHRQYEFQSLIREKAAQERHRVRQQADDINAAQLIANIKPTERQLEQDKITPMTMKQLRDMLKKQQQVEFFAPRGPFLQKVVEHVVNGDSITALIELFVKEKIRIVLSNPGCTHINLYIEDINKLHEDTDVMWATHMKVSLDYYRKWVIYYKSESKTCTAMKIDGQPCKAIANHHNNKLACGEYRPGIDDRCHVHQLSRLIELAADPNCHQTIIDDLEGLITTS